MKLNQSHIELVTINMSLLAYLSEPTFLRQSEETLVMFYQRSDDVTSHYYPPKQS